MKVYLNKGGRLAEQPDAVIELPQLETGFKLRICWLNGDHMADFLATSYRDGEIDAEGADASSMPFGEWQETHGTNGATATVEPKVIYFEEVVS